MSRKKRQPLPCTDSGNAERLAALFGQVLRYDHKRSRWLIWDRKRCRWTEDMTGEVRKYAIVAARHRRAGAARLVDPERGKQEIRWTFESEHRYRIDAALELAKSLTPVSDPGDGWDADPWLLGVANGVVDLRTGKMRPARPEDQITKCSHVAFDPEATCPSFERFIREVFGGDADLIRYVQKAGGYTLTGNTREQCLFACEGSGANGKSTWLEILLHLLGDYGQDLPFHVLEPARNGSMPGEAVNLPGARFVKCVEIREGRQLDEARIKALTGGDTISIRPLYRNAVSFKPEHKLWVAFNHRPTLTDDSPAMWRRVRLIPFTQRFDGKRADKDLLDKLKAESSGILNWLIEGCLLWQREGLEPPSPVELATREYECESDSLGPFLDECCVIGPDESVLSATLWAAYRKWTEQDGDLPLSRSAFAVRLKKRGCVSNEEGHGKQRVWQGLSVRLEWGGAGARVDAGVNSQDSPSSTTIRENSVNGDPQAPAHPQTQAGGPATSSTRTSAQAYLDDLDAAIAMGNRRIR